MLSRTLIIATLGIIIAAAAWTQPPDPQAGEQGLAAMREIALLAGEWTGEGWMRRGPGEPSRFASRETVEPRLDGRLLLVEGLHHAEESGEVVHHAFAVISYDADSGGYRFRSHLADGRTGDHAASLKDGSFVWGMETPRGKIRYTIDVDENEWHEVGEFSADGEAWNHFFQMDLTRVTD